MVALSPRFSRKVRFQVWPAAKATPLPEASFRQDQVADRGPGERQLTGDPEPRARAAYMRSR